MVALDVIKEGELFRGDFKQINNIVGHYTINY